MFHWSMCAFCCYSPFLIFSHSLKRIPLKLNLVLKNVVVGGKNYTVKLKAFKTFLSLGGVKYNEGLKSMSRQKLVFILPPKMGGVYHQ